MITLPNRLTVLAIAILGVGAAVAILSRGKRCPEPRHVEVAPLAINRPGDISFLQSCLASITDKQLDGTITTYEIPYEKPKAQRLTLTSGKNLRLPDHHGYTDFALVSVVNNKATIAYLSWIDLSSFGKNSESVATGVVTIDVVKAGLLQLPLPANGSVQAEEVLERE